MSRRSIIVVYLAYTISPSLNKTLIAVYKKSSYQKAYDWLANIAERHGGKVEDGPGSTAAIFSHELSGPKPAIGVMNHQTWWLERHEVI